MIYLKEINEDNFDAIVAMRRPQDEKFVAANVYSLAQAWLYRDNNDVFPLAIYQDEALVGFLLLEDDIDEKKLVIWRIMFPEENTNQGYGTATIKKVIDEARKTGKYTAVFVDCDALNTRARHVYEKIGFIPTGDINHGAVEMKFTL